LRGFSRFSRSRSLLLLPAVLAFSVRVAVAQSTPPITVTPAPPPGVSEAVSRILSWIMWAGWIAVAGAFIVGAIHFAMGDSEKGKKYVAGAIIMAFYTAVITGLVG